MKITYKYLNEFVNEINSKYGRSLKLVYQNWAYGFGLNMHGGSYKPISSLGMTSREAEAWLFGYREALTSNKCKPKLKI